MIITKLLICNGYGRICLMEDPFNRLNITALNLSVFQLVCVCPVKDSRPVNLVIGKEVDFFSAALSKVANQNTQRFCINSIRTACAQKKIGIHILECDYASALGFITGGVSLLLDIVHDGFVREISAALKLNAVVQDFCLFHRNSFLSGKATPGQIDCRDLCAEYSVVNPLSNP